MFIQRIQRKIKNKFIKKTLRKIKESYFTVIDFLGGFIFFLGRLLGLLPVRQDFSKDKIKKILIIRTDRIGDVICSLPTVRALKENFPESLICFLTTSYTEDLVSENKDIDEIIVYERKASISQKIDFIKRLKKYKFDLAIVLSPYFESALFGYLSGAKFRIGYPLNGSGFLLTTKINIKSRYKHEIESCLDVVRAIGVDTQDKQPRLSISQGAEKYAEDFFAMHKISFSDLVIGIHSGGYEKHTRWIPEGYAKVADILIREYRAKVILLGSRLDKEILDKIIKLMSQRPILTDFDISLQRLAGIIKRCNIFLGNNSGPMHIAVAVGTPVVAIFGAIHPLDSENKWAPYGEEHIIVRKQMDCIDCHPGYCRDLKCIKMITIEDVLATIKEQIKKR